MKSKIKAQYQRIIDYSRVKLRIDANYLFRGSLVLSIGQIAAGISGFLLTIILVRVFDKVEYGFYAYIFSIIGATSAFTLSGMDTAMAQAVAKNKESTLIQGFLIKLKWAFPALLITFSIGLYYILKGNEVIGYPLLISSFFIPLLSSSSLYTAYFTGKKQFKKITTDNILKNITITCGMIFIAFITHSVFYVVITYFVLSTLISLVRFLALKKQLKSEPLETDEGSITLGKHLSAMESITAIATHIDKIIIFQLLGATSLAVYVLSLAPIKQMHGISKLIKTLAVPRFSSRSIQELKHGLPQKLKVSFLLCVFIVIFYCALSPTLFRLFFATYTEAIIYSQVLSVSLLFTPFILYVQALSTLGKTRELYILNTTKIFTKLILLVVFVPLFGIWGAILAYLGMHVVTSILTIWQFKYIQVN